MTYDSEVLADTPRLYFKTNEASGTITDSSGNGLNLTIPGGSPTYAQTGPSGAADAMSWPDSSGGTEYYALRSSLTSAGTTPFTLECWFYLSGTPTNPTPLVGLAFGYGNNSRRPIELYVGTDGKIKALSSVASGTNPTILSSSSAVSLNAWHHVTAMFDNGVLRKIRLDKTDVASDAPAISFTTSPSFFIRGGGTDAGGVVDLTNGSVVLISKAALYQSILTDARSDAHYDAMPQAVTGTLATTLGDTTLAGAGEQDFTGTLATTLDDTTLAAAGTSADSGATGTLAVTLDDATLAGAGAETFTGTLASTLDDSTLAGDGVVANPVTGTLAATLDDTGLAASGTEAFTGTLAVALDDTTMAATGAEAFTGSLAIALDDATFASSGTETIPGTLSTTLADTLLVAVATETVAGLLAVTLDDTVLHATGNGNVPPSRDVTIVSVLERVRTVTTTERTHTVTFAEPDRSGTITERPDAGTITERTRTVTVAERTVQ